MRLNPRCKLFCCFFFQCLMSCQRHKNTHQIDCVCSSLIPGKSKFFMLKALRWSGEWKNPDDAQHCRWFVPVMSLVPSGFPPPRDHLPWTTVSETSHFSTHKTSHFLSGSTRPRLCVEGFSGFHFNQALLHSWKIYFYSKRNMGFICQMPKGTIQHWTIAHNISV